MKKKSPILLIIIALLLVAGLFGVEDTPQEPTENAISTTVTTTEATSTDNTVESVTDDESTTKKETTTKKEATTKKPASSSTTLKSIPAYSGRPYIALNNNQPDFTSADYTTKAFERYEKLDSLGRCGVAYACVGVEIMPTEDRGAIGQVKPTGWHTVKYDCVDGKYLYNRCHLIGFQLTGENANTRNLITGTRYMNVDGMLPFENMVADYVKETGNHVLYRVTPIFKGNNRLASGVQMEAYSIEDNGDGICFNVYCYNVQPGVEIDYATGDSRLKNGATTTTTTTRASSENSSEYILNTSSKLIHKADCPSVKRMSEKNKKSVSGRELNSYVNDGYKYCKNCS